MFRSISILLSFVMVSACIAPVNFIANDMIFNSAQKRKQALANLYKLQGYWIRTNDKRGQQSYEEWRRVSDSKYIGLGYMMKDQDTVFVEKLMIEINDSEVNYIVSDVNEKPTVFNLYGAERNDLWFKNDRNEYPKKIHYKFKNGKMLATISGGGPEVLYDYEKVER